MRIHNEDKEAKQILHVLVTCPHCHYRKKVDLDSFVELDTIEGWVDVLVPKLPDTNLEVHQPNPDTDDPDAAGEFEYETVTLTGKVEVIFQPVV